MTHGAVGIIPARYGSTRLPGKLLEDLGGMPVIERTLRNLLAAGRVTEVVVATDDERIADVSRAAGARVLITREEHETGTDRIGEAVRRLGLEGRTILNLQGDEPFLTADSIDACVLASQRTPHWDISTLATPCKQGEAQQSAVVNVAVAADGPALYFSRSPIPWSETGEGGHLRHIGIYAFQPGILERFLRSPRGRLEVAERLEQLRALESGMSIGVTVGDYSAVAIDTREDLIEARAMWSRQGPARRGSSDGQAA